MSLRLARGFKLPVDVAGEAIAILAKRGAGKTNTAVVLVEEMHANGVQIVVLDPVGVWWGLRSGSDGTETGGLRVPVIGGSHGDVPLEPAAGELIADVVVETGQSIVADVSEMSKTQQRAFVADFSQRLYRAKGQSRSVLHVVLEEADEFAPQRVSNRDAPMVGAISQLIRRGRSRGIGMTVITQRSASLNKDVLDQADVLVAMRTTGPRDRKAIEGWIEHQDAEGVELVLPSLPSLQTGEAWVWNPERSVLERIMVRHRRTFDTSGSPGAGGKRAEPRSVAPIDLAALGKRIEETAERAKRNDPSHLRREITRLERELQRATAQTKTETVEVEKVVEVEKRVEVPALTAADRKLIERAAKAAEKAAEAFTLLAPTISKIAQPFAAMKPLSRADLDDLVPPRPFDKSVPYEGVPSHAAETQTEPTKIKYPQKRPALGRVPEFPKIPDMSVASTNGELTGPQQRVVDAIAWLHQLGLEQPDRIQVGFMSGYRVSKKGGGTFANVLGQLRRDGLIDYPTSGAVVLTEAGHAKANDPGFDRTPEALQQAVLARLSGTEQRVLRIVIDSYPNPIGRIDLGTAAGYTVTEKGGGTFANILGRLRGLGLIDYPSTGQVVATELLFP